MDKFSTFTSTVAPLPLNDVDTDMLIPAQFLTSISKDGYGQNLFRRLRDGDPEFFLNQSLYADAQILVGGSNFGCGSSREHAVWALTGAGFRVVIAKSFADIFFSNSAKNGLLLVTLPDTVVDGLLESAAQEQYQITVSLEAQTVALPTKETISFEYDPFRKHCLLNGLDDIDYILAQRDAIEQFRSQQEKNRYSYTDQV